jgi:hypothetical protein
LGLFTSTGGGRRERMRTTEAVILRESGVSSNHRRT